MKVTSYSSIQKPFGFFSELLKRGSMLDELRQEYFEYYRSISNESHIIDNEDHKMVYSIIESPMLHPESGEAVETNQEEVYTTTFREYLCTLCLLESNNSITFIGDKIENFNFDNAAIKTYLKLCISELNYLAESAKTNNNIKLKDVYTYILLLIKGLYNKYRPFLYDVHIPHITEALASQPVETNKEELHSTRKTTTSKKHTSKIGFTWQKSDKELNDVLEYLIDKRLVSCRDKESLMYNLKLGFSGKEITKPLNILWHLRTAISLKAPLVRLLKLLMKLKAIEFSEKTTLANKIALVFVDLTGANFKNLNVTVKGISSKIDLNEIELHNVIISILTKDSKQNVMTDS